MSFDYPSEEMEIHTAPYRVLIVDDVPAVREALHWAFEDTPDLEVVGEAVDGLEALTSASILIPDVVILDVGLPHLDGFSVARRLKQMFPTLLIVFLTVSGDALTRQKAADAGGDGFVEKGAGWSALIAQIRHLLTQRNLPPLNQTGKA